MINQIVLLGRLGRDPELRYSASGTAISTFSLCFNSYKEKVGWIEVTSFNKLAESISKNLVKGSKVVVSGMLDEDKWEDQSGNKKSKLKIICNNIEFLSKDIHDNKNDYNQNDYNLPF
jgi:single-strand DNA-binding protein